VNDDEIKAKWFASLWERFDFPRGVHLRRIHDQLVSQDPRFWMRAAHPR
jgi:hypothetical protein